MLDDKLIKKSKCEIPEMSASLIESIEAEIKKPVQKKTHKFKLKVFIPVLATCLVLLLIIPLSISLLRNKKSYNKYGSDKGDIGLYDLPYDIEMSDDISYIESYSKKISGAEEEFIEPDATEGDKKNQNIRSGMLTASAYDDNSHYEYYQKLLLKGQTDEENGIFSKYFDNFDKNIQTRYRYEIKLNKDMPAIIELIEGENTIYQTVSDKDGMTYLYYSDNTKSHKIKLRYFNSSNEITVITEDIASNKDYTNITDYKPCFKDKIELMFVIDTTGSMLDEISYIQAEVLDIISKIKAQNPNTEILLAMMVYRDNGDDYITRYSDFTTDIESQKAFISKETAGGGGDFEEAVDVAFNEALLKNWSGDFSTKIIVHIADAPAHDEKIEDLFKNIKELSSKGIKIIPVASSGINKKTEYFMRNEAILTQSIYTYLTNDSGIGGSHIDATVEEKPEVELLTSLLVRLINGMHKGEFSEPINYMQDPSLNLNK